MGGWSRGESGVGALLILNNSSGKQASFELDLNLNSLVGLYLNSFSLTLYY